MYIFLIVNFFVFNLEQIHSNTLYSRTHVIQTLTNDFSNYRDFLTRVYYEGTNKFVWFRRFLGLHKLESYDFHYKFVRMKHFYWGSEVSQNTHFFQLNDLVDTVSFRCSQYFFDFVLFVPPLSKAYKT